MKDVIVALRIEKELKEKLQKRADADNRKLSDFLHLHLKKLVDNKG